MVGPDHVVLQCPAEVLLDIPVSCQLSMAYLKPLLGYTGVWLQYVQSLTTTLLNSTQKFFLIFSINPLDVPSLPAHPVS